MRELWSRIEQGDQTVDDLRQVVHKVAGAAGTYGYASLSIVGSELEQALKDGTNGATTSETHHRVGSLIGALEDASREPPKFA